MNILLTAISLVALIGCFLAYTRAQREADAAGEQARGAQAFAAALKSERARINDLEREAESLRRELRKLSGKFYAELAAREVDYDEEQTRRDEQDLLAYGTPFPALPVCENWKASQTLGPFSEAASCECAYCVARRAERRRLRGELVPRTVQGQAEVAKLNAGKP